MNGRVLIFCEGIWLAHTARALAVGRALKGAGREVHFGASGRFAELPRREGFPVHAVSTMDPEAALAAVRSTRIGYNRRVIEQYVEDELTLLRRLEPDFVVNDFRLPVAISARLAGVPFANILNAYWTGCYAPRRRSPRDFLLTRVLGRRAADAVLPSVMATVLKMYARPFNAVAASRALPGFRDIFDVMASPHLNLVCDLEEFGPLDGAPASYRHVGPILWEPDVAVPEWLDDIDPSRPTVYFSMGSTGLAQYYAALRHAFEGTGYQVLVTTGASSGGAPSGADELPGNFRVASLAPALALIRRCGLVICHGGNGTIYQALSCGVPVLGIPTFHDQDFNMQRVEDLGAGRALYPRELTGHSLREAADLLIDDARARGSCSALAARIRSTDAPSAALSALDEAFARHAPARQR